jgi:hypothetical protein
MARTQRFKPEQIIQALIETRGMVTLAAEHLVCDTETIYNYAKRYPSVEAELKKQRERITDIAESKLYEAIDAGESWAIQYYLRTQGRVRGYAERQDINLHHFIADEVSRLDGLSDDEKAALIQDVEAYANGRP